MRPRAKMIWAGVGIGMFLCILDIGIAAVALGDSISLRSFLSPIDIAKRSVILLTCTGCGVYAHVALRGIRQAEAALEESRERYRRLVEHAPICIHEIDLDGRIISMNEAGLKMLGVNRLEELGEAIYVDLVSDKDQPRLKRLLRDAMDGAPSEFEFNAGENDRLLFASCFVPIRNSAGSISAIMGVSEEISERRRAEEKILLLKRAVQSATNGVAIVDVQQSDMPIIYVNKAFSRTTGYAQEEILGRNCRFLQSDDRGQPELKTIRAAIAEARECHVVLRNYKKDGTLFYNELRLAPVQDTSGTVRHFVGILDDVTERIRTQQAIQRTRDQLEERVKSRTNELFETNTALRREITERRRAEDKNREHQDQLAHVQRVATMGEMATGLAHEINQPLAAIVNDVGACKRMLDRRAENEQQLRAAMSEAYDNAMRAGEIIRRLRALVRKRASHRSEIDINEVIREAASVMKDEARRNGISMCLDLAEEPQMVEGDQIQIEQVLINLVRNSFEALQDDRSEDQSKDRSVVIKSASADERGVAVDVTDSGPGFVAKNHEELFWPFRTTKSDGLGMGLSISRSIIESHGGDLRLASHQGRGARIRFTLPKHRV